MPSIYGLAFPVVPAGNPTGPLVVLGTGLVVTFLTVAWVARLVSGWSWPCRRAVHHVSRGLDRMGLLGSVVTVLFVAAVTFLVGLGLAEISRIWTAHLPVSDPIYQYFLHRRTPWLTDISLSLTHLGDRRLLDPVGAVASGILFLRQRRVDVLVIALASEFELRLQTWVGQLLPVAKPIATSIGPAGGCPSGGTARVLLVFGLIAFFLHREMPATRWRSALASVVGVLTFLEAWTRIYLGRHWTVDIVAGVVFGAVLLVGLLFTADRIPQPPHLLRKRNPSPSVSGYPPSVAHPRPR